MKLNKRLMTVASFVEPENTVIDVGCDHAFLDIYLIEQHLAKRVIASDNKEGPLHQAKKHIQDAKLEGEIQLQLANGIEKLDADIDTLVISGMGGRNMIGICKYLPRQRKQLQTIILSPNNDVAMVRKEFVKMGYYIDHEDLVEEGNMIYPVLRFRKGRKFYTPEDYIIGPILKRTQGACFQKWNAREIKQKEMLLKIMPKKYWQRKWTLKREWKIHKKYQS